MSRADPVCSRDWKRMGLGWGTSSWSPRRLTIFAVTPVYSLSWPQQKGLALTITEPVPICYPAGLTAAEKRANANLTVA